VRCKIFHSFKLRVIPQEGQRTVRVGSPWNRTTACLPIPIKIVFSSKTRIDYAGFKQLSKKYHPDCRGTGGQFKELNNLKEQLDKFIK